MASATAPIICNRANGQGDHPTSSDLPYSSQSELRRREKKSLRTQCLLRLEGFENNHHNFSGARLSDSKIPPPPRPGELKPEHGEWFVFAAYERDEEHSCL